MRRPAAVAAVLGVLGLGSVAFVRASAGAPLELPAGPTSQPAPGAPGQAPPALDPVLASVRLAPDLAREEQQRHLEAARKREGLLSLDARALRDLVASNPGTLGTVSFGRVNGGGLFNAEQMPESPLWHVVHPEKAWGTAETIAGLARAIERVHEAFADTPPLWIGDISTRSGGWLRPHRSHQSGQDVDVGFFYADDSKWYTRATDENLDRARTWVFLQALLRETDVELIFLDRSIQRILVDYAGEIGEDPAFIDQVFEGQRRRTQCTVRHEWGHSTHMHIRFESRVSREMGTVARPILVERGLLHGPKPRRR